MMSLLNFKDIAKIFEELELNLIASLKRNLSRHKDWEKEENFSWSAWQAEKLQNIEKFRRENQSILGEYKDVIDKETRTLMEGQFKEGEELINSQLAELRENMPDTTESNLVKSDNFFGVNQKKMDTLISDITQLEKNVSSAALRMTDDIYRQTLNKVQLSIGTGSETLSNAIDSAVKDFLDKGINCIEYKDGRRVNIVDYVRMALRTTSTRAQLQGEAKRRRELGYDTVVVSQYGMCSETCLPWQGRVYIDDVFTVWSGEISGDKGKSNYCGKWFKLLSVAIKGGLFHPNCRHSIDTWIDGVSTLPKPLDINKVREKAKLEAKQRRLENNVRKAKRKVLGFSDPRNIKQAKADLREAQKELREFVSEHSDILKRDYSKEKVYENEVRNNYPNAVENSAVRNTRTRLEYNPKSDFKISIENYDNKINDGLSKACHEVAELGGKDGLEHLCLVDLDTGDTIYRETGKENEVGGSDFWSFIRNNSYKNISFVHNHNTDGFFSEADMRTLLSTDCIKDFSAVRIDGVIYYTQKKQDKKLMDFYLDRVYENELKELTALVRSGKISIAERVIKREEIIVENLLKDYTKGLIEFDGRK